jgi:hypothetical protein
MIDVLMDGRSSLAVLSNVREQSSRYVVGNDCAGTWCNSFDRLKPLLNAVLAGDHGSNDEAHDSKTWHGNVALDPLNDDFAVPTKMS